MEEAVGLKRTPKSRSLRSATRKYFPGTVALLNSLRLTGNDGAFVVLDTGLNDAQRSRLERHASLMEPALKLTHPWLFKPFARFLDADGVIVIIDSDMIVTRFLDDVIDQAAGGKICVFPDHPSQTARWFREWATDLELRAPLRRQTYVNAGFIALSTRHWPNFLSRFAALSERVPVETIWTGSDEGSPFWAADHDVLNALLMSEVPFDAMVILPQTQEVHPELLAETRIVDARTLECVVGGERPAILHYSMAPKAWNRTGWIRVRRDAYVRLFGRVVLGNDVALSIERDELPLWLRTSRPGKSTLTALDVMHGFGTRIRRRLPPRISAALVKVSHALIGSRRP